MVLFLIPLIGSLALLGLLVFTIYKLTKNRDPKQKEYVVDKKDNLTFMLFAIGTGITTVLSSLALVAMKSWELKAIEMLALIFGSFILGSCAAATITAFGLHYYKVDLCEKQKKVCKTLMIVGLIATILGLWLFTEGIANQDIYPLISGIDFNKGWIHGNENGSIKFYGIVIVCGALICYFITDHYSYKKFGEHGLIDTLFIVAFLAGVLGARLWYCLVLEKDYFLAHPNYIIYGVDAQGNAHGIMEGGLAIQGGALGGILVGVLFVLIFRKYIDVRYLMDVAIPTILIAQVMGRWGNFFNNEVHGLQVNADYFKWLPSIIRNNMVYSSTEGIADPGNIWLPLFFIEGVINIGGFFFIRYVLGKLLKFGFGKGYQSAAYIAWYGLVRVCLEPLRVGFTLNVGSSDAYGYMQSWITGFVMIGIGIALFLVLYFIHRYRFNKGLEDANGDKIKKAA